MKYLFFGFILIFSPSSQVVAQSGNDDLTLSCSGISRISNKNFVERSEYTVKINTVTGIIYDYTSNVASGCYNMQNITQKYISDQIIKNECRVDNHVITQVSIDRYNLNMSILEMFYGKLKSVGIWKGEYKCKIANKRKI